MKRVIFSLGLLAVLLSICSCQQRYTVSVSIYQFKLTNESVQLVSDIPIEQPLSITVSYEIADEDDEVSTVMLADGPLIDGKLELTQEVAEPTEVEVLVRSDASNPNARATATTVLRPSAEIDFVVIRKISSFSEYHSHTVLLKGNDHRSLKNDLKFSIKGDLSRVPWLTSQHVRVSVEASPSIVDGRGEIITFGPILLDQGEFSVEGDLEAPTLFSIKVSHGTDIVYELDNVHAVLEPGVDYSVVPLGEQGSFAVLADQRSLHSHLVSSWQMDPEFVALVDSRIDSRLDARWGMETEAREQYEKEHVENYRVSNQCTHVSLTDEIKERFITPYRYSYLKTNDQIVTARTEALRKILRDTRDIDLVRIILELIWRQLEVDGIYTDRFLDEWVATLFELERIVDQEFIDQFVTPRVEYLAIEKSMKLRNRWLRPGQVAPQFTLPSITGDEVSLSEVLSNNELVLVDFWASWCGQCTRSFPVLKDLYSEYKDRGFEIVTISIDDSVEAWQVDSKNYELPWIDLGEIKDGEMKGGSSPTADDYGVRWRNNSIRASMLYGINGDGQQVTPESIRSGSRRWIPNRFLIDNKGCILNKQFSNFELQKMLSTLTVGSS